MTAITFDTHEFVENLVESGLGKPQAEALAKELKNMDTHTYQQNMT